MYVTFVISVFLSGRSNRLHYFLWESASTSKHPLVRWKKHSQRMKVWKFGVSVPKIKEVLFCFSPYLIKSHFIFWLNPKFFQVTKFVFYCSSKVACYWLLDCLSISDPKVFLQKRRGRGRFLVYKEIETHQAVADTGGVGVRIPPPPLREIS